MTFSLPILNYWADALEPFISSETFEYHHLKHHKTYVDNLNNLIKWTELENMTLDELIVSQERWKGIFNNAAQVWNHTFYFEQFAKHWADTPSWRLMDMILNKWWDFETFKSEFSKMAVSNFWSWWTWLTLDKSSNILNIWNTSNANTPLTSTIDEWILIPILTCDVWEHAYYIDYRNRRAEYLENFWKIIDWKIIDSRFESI